MTATIKKIHQGLDNVDFIGTENINGSLQLVLVLSLNFRPISPDSDS